MKKDDTTNKTVTTLSRGQRAPDFVLPSSGIATRFYGCAGGAPTLIVFSPTQPENIGLAFLDALGDMPAFVVAPHPPGAKLAAKVFLDPEGTVSAAYGAEEGKGRIVLLDASLRVLRTFEAEIPISREMAATVIRAASELPPVEPRLVAAQAPVLLVPRVLDRGRCEQLVEVWRQGGNQETGVEVSKDGLRVESVRGELKRRRDHTVDNQPLIDSLVRDVGRCLLPEIRRAFSFPGSLFEGFKIAGYDGATGGFFGAHRDNLSPASAHRRFALSLNLNEDYEGGELCFPEYGPLLYRPAEGEALVFSCSLLHEVRRVTSGRRLVLLSFLFDQKALRGKPPATPRPA